MVWIFRSGGQTTCIAKIMHKHTHEDSKNKGGGGGSILGPPDHDLPNTARTQKFCGGEGGNFLIIMWNTAKQILRTKIERFGAYLGYFFHLNDYETKIHYFKNFGGGGGGTRAPAPPPLRTAMLPKKILYPTFYLPCTTYHHPSCRPPWTQHWVYKGKLQCFINKCY